MRTDHDNRRVTAYKTMALIRHFDKKAVNLQRTGRLGTYASSLGAEVIVPGQRQPGDGADRFGAQAGGIGAQ
ncbi:MAG: hypothetical protein RLN92_02000, partial [Alloalcanivorax xenomutans]